MSRQAASKSGSETKRLPQAPESNRQAVQPFGLSGVGVITSHPVGLVFVAGVVLITVEAIPAARWFVAAAVAIGIVFGISLWLYHRGKGLG